MFWDHGGFVIYYKRFERNRFKFPRVAPGATTIRLDATQLGMLLDGIDVDRVHRVRHWSPPSFAAAP